MSDRRKVSIILTCYNQTPFQAHMTMACIANITRYTETDDYELIVMDADPKHPIRDDYKCLKIDKHIETNLGYTASMNYGAKQADHDILVFMQNDVFVWEDWLRKMRWYIETGEADAIFPDQCPRSREFVKRSYKMDMIDAKKYGSRDAGLIMITKEAFEKTGGWNEDLSLLCDKDFYQRLSKAGVNYIDTCKVMITHIMAGTNLWRLHENRDEYEAMMKHDADLLNK